MNREEHARNVRAHRGLDRLDFAHQLINRLVYREAQRIRNTSISRQAQPPWAADIGCGTGYLLKKLIASGWKSIGLDPFPRGESLQTPLSRHVVRGTTDAVGSARFDLITAVEVIEHAGDYLYLLKEMRRLLKPGGRVILSVPNNWDFQTVVTDEGVMEPKYGHLWQFDTRGLQRDLASLFVDVGVKAIYSRWLERRSFGIIRHLPPIAVMAVSDYIVRRRNNGAWLLGWGTRAKGRAGDTATIPEPSAIHYLDSHVRPPTVKASLKNGNN